MKSVVLLPLVAALAFGGMATASAAPARDTLTLAAAAKKKHVTRHAPRHVRSTRQASGQIACTIYGCHRIPAHCRPVTGYNWWGDPTGFDEVACR